MAVVYTKSASLTAMDTPGSALPLSRLQRSSLKIAKGKVEVANGDSIGSVLRFVRIPSNAIIHQIQVKITGTITSAAGDLGVYRSSTSTTASGTVVDVDLFCSARTFASAVADWTDITNESASITATVAEYPLWQMAGASSDPGELYEIAITLTAAAAAAGQIHLAVLYSD